NVPVLLLGESGTGKEIVARAIHLTSRRSECSFVPVECSALPPTLAESELFGYQKGSFTGAYRDKIGLIEQANRGTVFLDEIGELTLDLQAKLLRVLQEHDIRRVGSTNRIPLDLRVIAATNRDLKTAVAQGVFRCDLYYRLNVVAITLPPLRQ